MERQQSIRLSSKSVSLVALMTPLQLLLLLLIACLTILPSSSLASRAAAVSPLRHGPSILSLTSQTFPASSLSSSSSSLSFMRTQDNDDPVYSRPRTRRPSTAAPSSTPRSSTPAPPPPSPCPAWSRNNNFTVIYNRLQCLLNEFVAMTYDISPNGTGLAFPSSHINWSDVQNASLVDSYLLFPPGAGRLPRALRPLDQVWSQGYDPFLRQFVKITFEFSFMTVGAARREKTALGDGAIDTISDSYWTTYENLNTGKRVRVFETYFTSFNRHGLVTAMGYVTDSFALYCATLLGPAFGECAVPFVFNASSIIDI